MATEEKKELNQEKDSSIFEGKPALETGDFINKLRDPNLYSKTNLGETERIEFGKKLFGSYGSYIERKEVEEAKRQLDLGKWGKFKDLSPEEKQKAERLIRGILGK